MVEWNFHMKYVIALCVYAHPKWTNSLSLLGSYFKIFDDLHFIANMKHKLQKNPMQQKTAH